jgi:hypothetical protein
VFSRRFKTIEENKSARPVCLYAIEILVLRNQKTIRIEGARMRFMRSVPGITLKNKLANEDLRECFEAENIAE